METHVSSSAWLAANLYRKNQTDLCYLAPAENRFTNSHVIAGLVNSHNQVTVDSHQTAQRYN